MTQKEKDTERGDMEHRVAMARSILRLKLLEIATKNMEADPNVILKYPHLLSL